MLPNCQKATKTVKGYQNCQNRMEYGPIFTVLFSLTLARHFFDITKYLSSFFFNSS